MASNVQFRRIGGRVVPIHINDQRISAAATAASGAGVSVAGGLVAAKLHKEAIGASKVSAGLRRVVRTLYRTGASNPALRTQTNRVAGQKVYQAATKLATARNLFAAGSVAKSAGVIGGGLLLGRAVQKVLPVDFKEKHGKISTALEVGTGLSAASITHAMYVRSLGNMFGGTSFRNAVKYGIKKGIKYWGKI